MHQLLSQPKKMFLTSLVMSIVLGVISSATFAAAPFAKTPAPGFFRMMLGEFEITVVSDGTVDLPVDKLLMQPEEKTLATLSKSHLTAPLETSVNTYLINTGTKLVLVDSGAGSLFGPTLGKFVANLKASGYTPEQIDHVFITHMHGDHIGGLMASGARTFPNAIIHADQHDADFWLSKAEMDKAPEDKKGAFQGAMVSLTSYVEAKKFAAFNGDTELVPGIKSIASYGHTPGHSIYEVESQGKKLWLIGDLIHVAAVQMDQPQVTIAFDSDQKQAAKTRDIIFTLAAKQGILIGATHLQFPGMGHLKKDENSYDWIPVNYTQMR